ncbi:MAG TPA: ABC transporter permease [Candidatus Scybalousia intestinigallinarum]|nr:ABC transporter permease [Candidatus Scybalousia intestinigallinarum]
MKSNLWNILKKELREMFNDKKSLSMMLIIPIMIPLLVIGMSALFESQINKPLTEYNQIGFNYEMSEEEEKLAEDSGINVVYYENLEDIESAYQNGEIDLYVTKKDQLYTIHGEDNETTSYASSLVENYFNRYKEYLQTEYLMDKEISSDEVIHIIDIEKDIKEVDNFYASYITNYAFLFIIMAITVSATYPATDTTAGEKERGTLETLLTFPIKSKDIIIGKFLSVSLSSVITGLISLILMIISLVIVQDMFTIYEGVNLMLPSASFIFALIVIIAYSFLISGLCIAIASKCKTFKEAQSALTPLTFISFFPGMIAFMINVKSSLLLALVPFLNFTLLFTDITAGNIDILEIGVMLLSTIIIIGITLYIIIKQYKSEKVLFNE